MAWQQRAGRMRRPTMIVRHPKSGDMVLVPWIVAGAGMVGEDAAYSFAGATWWTDDVPPELRSKLDETWVPQEAPIIQAASAADLADETRGRLTALQIAANRKAAALQQG